MLLLFPCCSNRVSPCDCAARRSRQKFRLADHQQPPPAAVAVIQRARQQKPRPCLLLLIVAESPGHPRLVLELAAAATVPAFASVAASLHSHASPRPGQPTRDGARAFRRLVRHGAIRRVGRAQVPPADGRRTVQVSRTPDTTRHDTGVRRRHTHTLKGER